jgi:hypothetical protein
MAKRQKDVEPDCVACRAQCCRYVTVMIDKPTCKLDYDNIRWYLMHQKVHIYIDHDGDWYVESETACENIGKDQLCHMYHDRPQVCRDHGEDDEQCVFVSDEEPHRVRFSTAAEFEAYLDKRKVDWKWKRRKSQK